MKSLCSLSRPVYLALLNATHVRRGVQVVGETSALGRESEPVTPFALVPNLPRSEAEFTPTSSVNLEGNGFAILRNDFPRTYLYLDYGIMGGEHGHPDRLQMGVLCGRTQLDCGSLNESYMNPTSSYGIGKRSHIILSCRPDEPDLDKRLRQFLWRASLFSSCVGRLDYGLSRSRAHIAVILLQVATILSTCSDAKISGHAHLRLSAYSFPDTLPPVPGVLTHLSCES